MNGRSPKRFALSRTCLFYNWIQCVRLLFATFPGSGSGIQVQIQLQIQVQIQSQIQIQQCLGLPFAMFPGSVAGLPEEMATMPQLLRKAGYSAHMVSSLMIVVIKITIKVINIITRMIIITINIIKNSRHNAH